MRSLLDTTVFEPLAMPLPIWQESLSNRFSSSMLPILSSVSLSLSLSSCIIADTGMLLVPLMEMEPLFLYWSIAQARRYFTFSGSTKLSSCNSMIPAVPL